MQCPVCSNQAVDIGPKGFDGKVLRCPQCKDYEISGSFLLKFLAWSREDRGLALAKARQLAAAGGRPSIRLQVRIKKPAPFGPGGQGSLEHESEIGIRPQPALKVFEIRCFLLAFPSEPRRVALPPARAAHNPAMRSIFMRASRSVVWAAAAVARVASDRQCCASWVASGITERPESFLVNAPAILRVPARRG
jgi:hypothetical protein